MHELGFHITSERRGRAWWYILTREDGNITIGFTMRDGGSWEAGFRWHPHLRIGGATGPGTRTKVREALLADYGTAPKLLAATQDALRYGTPQLLEAHPRAWRRERLVALADAVRRFPERYV